MFGFSLKPSLACDILFTHRGKRQTKGGTGVGLTCRNGGKECDGCGECASQKDGRFCGRCGEGLGDGETYSDLFYDVLCLRCLMKLHKN